MRSGTLHARLSVVCASIVVVLSAVGVSGRTGEATAAKSSISAPAVVVLYQQMDSRAPGGGVTSQDFEPEFDQYDSFAADDFLVPPGQTWSVTGVDVAGEYNVVGLAASFHVFFYDEAAGNLPGTLVAARLTNRYAGVANANITLSSPVRLSSATYWVGVQARQDITTSDQWFWDNRAVTANQSAAWQNPGGGFGVCGSWGRKLTCLPSQNGPDQLFRVNGTLGEPPPPPSPPPPPPIRCIVPRLVGLALGRARRKILRAHCSVGRIRRRRARRAGRVLSQSPQAGARRPRNYPVRLLVGRA